MPFFFGPRFYYPRPGFYPYGFRRGFVPGYVRGYYRGFRRGFWY